MLAIELKIKQRNESKTSYIYKKYSTMLKENGIYMSSV